VYKLLPQDYPHWHTCIMLMDVGNEVKLTVCIWHCVLALWCRDKKLV